MKHNSRITFISKAGVPYFLITDNDNESQNRRSSSFGHENGGQQYWPLDGIDDNLGYAISS